MRITLLISSLFRGIATERSTEYLWVAYQDVEDSGSGKLVKQPLAVYIERVYEYGDFSLLGIGQ